MYILQYEKGKKISYGCSCSTNDDFDLFRDGPELWICPNDGNGRFWRFLVGAKQGPVMNQGDGILVLIGSMVTRNMASPFEYWQQVSKIK